MPSSSVSRPIFNAVATAGVSDRLSFLRRTYVHLGAALVTFALLSVGMIGLWPETSFQWSKWALTGTWNWLLVLGAFMLVGHVAERLAWSASSRALQYVGLVLAVVTQALLVQPLLWVLISGTLDGSSNVFVAGPAVQPSECGNGVAPANGGGAGGSLAGKGGDGGRGGAGGTGGGSSAAAGPASRLRGGCRGQRGSMNQLLLGPGGGALAILGDAITIDGSINASGSGGPGGENKDQSDGHGGGSGGMIIIDAPEIAIGENGQIFANGGGGGAGGQETGAGANGRDGISATTPAPGGQPAPTTGSGGHGSAGLDLEGSNGGNGIAGGGGGGGAGVIWMRPSVDGAISPPAS